MPRRSRPVLPKGYLSTKSSRGMVSWKRVNELLDRATQYFIATTNPDGRPHLVQQWGAWVDRRFFFEGSPETRWARNLARDARISVATERSSEVVIVEGVAEHAKTDRTLAEKIAAAYSRKYGRTYDYRPTPEQYLKDGAYAVTPKKVFAWDVGTFGSSLTRFTFE